MVTDSNCLWSHQLINPVPAGRAGFMSGVGVAGSWGGLEGCSQGESRHPVVAGPLPLWDKSVHSAASKGGSFYFTLNKSSSSLNSTVVMGVEISEMAERPTEHI